MNYNDLLLHLHKSPHLIKKNKQIWSHKPVSNSLHKITFIQLQFGIVSPALASGGIHVQVSSHLSCLTFEWKMFRSYEWWF